MIEEKTKVHNRTLYELVDKDGKVRGRFPSAQAAGIAARERWPDQEQDEDRTGKGWDVQVAEAPKNITRMSFVLDGTCKTCEAKAKGEMCPPHDASPRCESGKRPHCTCDTCF